MSQYYMLMTETGLAKSANAQVTGEKVDITHIAVGDGGGNAVTPAADMTALVNEVYRMPVSDYETSQSDANQIIVAGYIPTDHGGWTIREVGVFDADGDLIAVGNLPDTPKPVLSAGIAKDLLIRATLEVTNAADVIEINIDPTVIIASRSYVDQAIESASVTTLASIATLGADIIENAAQIGAIKTTIKETA
jgi:phage-related tail fiber protein